MKTYLEYKDEKSHKFWEVEQKGKTHTLRYGKVDSDGRENIKDLNYGQEVCKSKKIFLILKYCLVKSCNNYLQNVRLANSTSLFSLS